jgi:hypothetical protein
MPDPVVCNLRGRSSRRGEGRPRIMSDNNHNWFDAFDEEDEEEERGTTEYLRRRLQTRVDCPLCAYYDAWNVDYLRDHVSAHKEVKRYAPFWRNILFL